MIDIQCSFIFLKAYNDLHSVGLMYNIFKGIYFVAVKLCNKSSGEIHSKDIIRVISRRCGFVLLFFGVFFNSPIQSPAPKYLNYKSTRKTDISKLGSFLVAIMLPF